MNFSHIVIDHVRWSAPKNKKSTCSHGSGKVRFQTPRTSIKISPSPKFQGALQLELDPTAFPDAFIQFIEDMQCAAHTQLHQHLENKRCYSPMKRMMAFDDALVFDQDGNLQGGGQCDGRYDASLILQVDGTWVTELSWGLRVRVLEIKIHAVEEKKQECAPAVTRILLDGKPFLFLNDDDDD